MEARGAVGREALAGGRRSVAQWACLVGGGYLVARALVGAAVLGETSFATPGEGWHALVHLASGLVLVALSRAARPAALGLLAFAGFYGAVAALGFAGDGDVLGLIPTPAAANVFHTVVASGSAAAALVSLRR